MSCPDFIYTPLGRQGIGVVQPQSGLDYPLVSPSEDIRYLIADFYLAFDDLGEYSKNQSLAALPLRIKYLYGVGCGPSAVPAGGPVPANAADIVVVDDNGVEILNTCTTGTAFTSREWGTDYVIYEWLTANCVCRLVAYKTWHTGEPTPANYPQYFAPAAATIDARATYKMPRRLRSLRVRQRDGTTTNGPYTGKVRFRNNFNVEIDPGDTTTTNFIRNTRVTFSAEAGSGTGYFPVCGSGYDEETQELIPQPIKQINGVAANADGDFLLAGSDCMYVRRPTVISGQQLTPSTTAQQQIGADCAPCCACADYVSTALYMNQVRDQYKLIGVRANEVKTIHEDNIEKWQQKRQCTLNNPLKLIMVPQCCPTMDIVVMLCNPCTTCVPASVLNLELTPSAPAALSTVCGETTIYGANGATNQAAPLVTAINGKTNIAIQLPPVTPGSSGYAKIRVKSATRANISLTGVLTGTFIDNTPILTGCVGETPRQGREVAQTIKTAAFNCAADGTSNRPC